MQEKGCRDSGAPHPVSSCASGEGGFYCMKTQIAIQEVVCQNFDLAHMAIDAIRYLWYNET